MFGRVWPVPQWAGLGTVVGALYHAFHIMTGPPQPWSYNSGRILGGMFVGAALGAITAVVRNSLTSNR